MGGVLEGFLTIGVVIVLGVLLAHRGILNLDSQAQLSRLSFYVASPALMVTVLADADLAEVFSQTLTASVAGVIASGGLYVLAARTSGDATWPTRSSARCRRCTSTPETSGSPSRRTSSATPPSWRRSRSCRCWSSSRSHSSSSTTRPDDPAAPSRASLLAPLTNPLTVASLVGVALSLSGITLPSAVSDPLELVGGMAVPAMLLAYGVSLRLGPRPGRHVALGDRLYHHAQARRTACRGLPGRALRAGALRPAALGGDGHWPRFPPRRTSSSTPPGTTAR